MSTVKIRLGDWRDRDGIQPLRKLVHQGLEGGLWELLHWPIYHVHTAVFEGRTVGFAASMLSPDGMAESVGVVVHPDYRRQRIGALLLATQLRDLDLMGVSKLFGGAPRAQDALSFAVRFFGDPLGRIEVPGTDPSVYFGAPLADMKQRLDGASDAPYPLSDVHYLRLLSKTEAARRDLATMMSLAQVAAIKLALKEPASG